MEPGVPQGPSSCLERAGSSLAGGDSGPGPSTRVSVCSEGMRAAIGNLACWVCSDCSMMMWRRSVRKLRRRLRLDCSACACACECVSGGQCCAWWGRV